MQNIVITGVSSGIGYALVQDFIKKGYHVLGTVRSHEKGQALKEAFGIAFTPLVFDICDAASIENALKTVQPKLEKEGLVGLINNAGIANPGAQLLMPIAEFQEQLEVNVVGQVRMIQAFAPFLGASLQAHAHSGRIVNISSTSAKISMPFLGAYSASKAALEALSNSLRCELQLYGIKVIIIRPGVINTPIWDKAETKDLSVFDASDYAAAGEKFKNYAIAQGRKGMPVELLSAKILRIFEKKSPRHSYTILPNRFSNWIIPNLLPRKVLDKYLGKLFGLTTMKNE